MKLARLVLFAGASFAILMGACNQESTQKPIAGAVAASGGDACDPDDRNDYVCQGCVNPNIGFLPTCVGGAWLCECPPTSSTSTGGSGGSGGSQTDGG